MRKLLLAALTAAALVVPATAQAHPWGAGKVSAYGVGALRFNSSSPSNLFSWAGSGYSRIEYQTNDGGTTQPGNGDAAYAIVEYGTKGLDWARPGYVDYVFWWNGNRWVFTQFITSLQRFHTAQGITVGMTKGQARARAQRPFGYGCIGEGYWRYLGNGRNGGDLADIGHKNRHVDYLVAWGKHQMLC